MKTRRKQDESLQTHKDMHTHGMFPANSGAKAEPHCAWKYYRNGNMLDVRRAAGDKPERRPDGNDWMEATETGGIIP